MIISPQNQIVNTGTQVALRMWRGTPHDRTYGLLAQTERERRRLRHLQKR